MLQPHLKKEFALPIIRRPVNGDIKLWISGRARASNDRIEDLSNNKNSDEIIGATWFPAPSGHSVLKFDGVDDYLQVLDDDSIDLTSNYTIECWFYPDQLNAIQTLISKHEHIITKSGWYLNFNNDNKIRHGAGDGTTWEAFGLNSTNVYPKKAWYHAVATNDGSKARIYVNGIRDGEGAAAIVAKNTQNLWIGNNVSSGIGAYDFKGKIDEVRFYNRVLTSEEIRQRYENTKYLFGL